MLKTKPIVEVTWTDAWTAHRIYDADDDHTGLLSKSIGYEMEYTDVSIVLAALVTEASGGGGKGITVIPTAYIVKVEELIQC